MPIAAILQSWVDRLTREGGIPRDEAHSMMRLLAADTLNLPLRELAFHMLDEADTATQRAIDMLAQRLLEGEPLQYVLGETEFMALPFRCSPCALIPRMDSEVLVERAIALLRNQESPQIADVCCGSGAYGLALAYYLPTATVLCCDISAEALALAEENACLLQVNQRVRFRCGDLLEPLRGQQNLDLIVCNPPYVCSRQIATLERHVQREPRLALDGGADGLDFYRRLCYDIASFLRPAGWLLLEHGDEQQKDIENILRHSGLQQIEEIQDYGHRDRGLLYQKV